MYETIMAFGFTMIALAVLAPLGLLYLLTRQIAPYRPLQTFLVVLVSAMFGPVGLFFGLLWAVRRQRRAARRASRAVWTPAPTGLGRNWNLLVRDAATAARRYHQAIGPVAPGPLRDTLADAAIEVDQAVEEARRIAVQGDRTERAHREVLAALDSQRKRTRSGQPLPADLEESLHAAARAQHDSAERLAAAAHHDRCQLELLVARLHELAGHALELTTVSSTTATASALSLADRVAALRLATAELDAATA